MPGKAGKNAPPKAPGPLWDPSLPPVGPRLDGHGTARPLTAKELEKNVASARSPIYLSLKEQDDNEGYASTWPAKIIRSGAPAKEIFHKRPNIHLPNVPQACAALLVPPIIFGHVAWMITFYTHYEFGRAAWFFASLALLPLLIVWQMQKKAAREGRKNAWYGYFIIVFALTFVYAAITSELNYWYFLHPFYSLRAMRTYTDINPSEVSGMRVMDAATVGFMQDARVVTDMAMSFTTWDVYCVAPIASPAGLPSQGGKLASYDFWAVGINCCKSGQTNFMCGEHDNPLAKKGLRLVDPEQVKYFRLAVQQAEAQYGIEARHPVFFHWVQDPDQQLARFFEQGFKNWIMAGVLHWCLTMLVLVFYVTSPELKSATSRSSEP
eukprot:TRINITY_DN15523_c0_g1_i1.p1 TRINITY_DN15523_c0_g1~~TRINITY_DN15523_c0_g1_i1.p1  ORF type:complete len:380 (-),score=65.94 TRINITY_DN15523_c0_g1_i1:446-1585(-)